jgi:hypothetical protein
VRIPEIHKKTDEERENGGKMMWMELSTNRREAPCQSVTIYAPYRRKTIRELRTAPLKPNMRAARSRGM